MPSACWEGWRHPESGEVLRTFCVITSDANELVADIHNRMPLILPPEAYDRWLSTVEPDPRELLVPFPAELMMMWPISTRGGGRDKKHVFIEVECTPEEAGAVQKALALILQRDGRINTTCF